MKLVHVRTITLSCMVGFENNLVQMIIMTKQCVMKKNHVIRSKVYVTMLRFINNVVEIIIMTKWCVANKNQVASLKFKVIDQT